MREYEDELYNQGYKCIGGIDEVGRGPLVGPVVACCVVLPNDFNCLGLTDSKQLSDKRRRYYYEIIKEKALAIGVGIVCEKEIDKINIYQATKRAMKEAILDTNINTDYLLIDAMRLDIDIPYNAIIKGDSKSISIAAASIVAKVIRDDMMNELDLLYPEYGFKYHKGYPTKKHLEAIKKYGIKDFYRMTYKPVLEIIKKV